MRFKKTLTALSTVAMLISPISANAVNNGVAVTKNTRVVALYFGQDAREYLCTGFLYSPTIVFTAAHCIHNLKPNELAIGKPDTRIRNFGTKVGAKSIIKYDSFNNKRFWSQYPKDDFAIIVLSKPIAKISKANLATQKEIEELRSRGALVSLAGYGFKSKKDRLSPSKSLTQALLPLASDDEVAIRLHNSGMNSFMLDGSGYFYYLKVDIGRSNSCDGDSGAGVFYMNNYIGLNAWPIHTPNCGADEWGIHGGLNRIDPIYHHKSLLKRAGIIIE